jgi:very-short-patch-repair endonuclease
MTNPFTRDFPFVAIVCVLGGGLLVFILLVRTLSRAGRAFPYERREALFTPPERAFLSVLQRAVGAEFLVFGKVRLADLIQPRARLPKQQFFQALGRVTSKHVDFVLCEPRSLTPVVAIELDDRSHQQAKRQERDRFVEGALAAAGLPLWRFPVQRHGPKLEELRARVRELKTLGMPMDHPTA